MSKCRTNMFFFEDFIWNLSFLAYFRPWHPSHWIRNAFLVHFGTENLENHQLGARIMSAGWIPQNSIFSWSFCREMSWKFSYRMTRTEWFNHSMTQFHRFRVFYREIPREFSYRIDFRCSHSVGTVPGNSPTELKKKFRPQTWTFFWRSVKESHDMFDGGVCPLSHTKYTLQY